MRLAFTLVLCLLATACRRPAAPAGTPAQVAAAPSPAPAPAVPAEPAEQPSPAAPAAQAAPPAPPPAEEAATAPTAPPDRPLAPAAAPAAPDGGEKPDGTIYSWVDAQGVLHFSTAEDIPPARRASARPVDGGVTIEDPGTSVAPPSPPPPAPAAARAEEAPAEAAEDEPPRRRAQARCAGPAHPRHHGATAATRAVQQAPASQLDPASVERKHQQELSRT